METLCGTRAQCACVCVFGVEVRKSAHLFFLDFSVWGLYACKNQTNSCISILSSKSHSQSVCCSFYGKWPNYLILLEQKMLTLCFVLYFRAYLRKFATDIVTSGLSNLARCLMVSQTAWHKAKVCCTCYLTWYYIIVLLKYWLYMYLYFSMMYQIYIYWWHHVQWDSLTVRVFSKHQCCSQYSYKYKHYFILKIISFCPHAEKLSKMS